MLSALGRKCPQMGQALVTQPALDLRFLCWAQAELFGLSSGITDGEHPSLSMHFL